MPKKIKKTITKSKKSSPSKKTPAKKSVKKNDPVSPPPKGSLREMIRSG